MPHIESGKLRVLGVASATRSPIYPQALTLHEQGLQKVIASGWYGFMAPAATPRAIVERMEKEINRALANDEIKQKLLAQGLEARGGSAAEFGKFVDDETRKWSELIRQAGLKGNRQAHGRDLINFKRGGSAGVAARRQYLRDREPIIFPNEDIRGQQIILITGL